MRGGLHATATAVNYAFYTHLTKYYSNSAEHNFLLITINGQASETKRDFSTSPHNKQNKHFLATTTALNTNETSKYPYLLKLGPVHPEMKIMSRNEDYQPEMLITSRNEDYQQSCKLRSAHLLNIHELKSLISD